MSTKPDQVQNALVDANGNRTSWTRDALGRVTVETRANGTTQTTYAYDLAGRLKSVTDPKGQVTTHTYLADDSQSNSVYTNTTSPTPSVTYTYDAVYRRVSTMADGTGTTTYTYKSPGQLGAGRVATVDGPLANDIIGYTYDQLGRVTNRAINGAANSVTWVFDTLGRVTSEQNVLGTFTYGYDGVTNRLATVTYPNNQSSTYSYFPNNQDHRLQTIHHQYPNLATLSKFDYTYDAVGNILTWRQQAVSTATLWSYGYDGADQLTRAVQQTTGAAPTILKRYGYGYDSAGNRTHEQIDDTVTAVTHDNLNRLLGQSPGGPIVVAGTTNEPATVTIQGKPAMTDPANVFRGTAPTTAGTTTFTVTAVDPNGNQATRQYQVPQTGAGKTFSYDANGNLISDGTRTLEWDAQNRIVTIIEGTRRSEFSYDGLDRRVRDVEYENGQVQSDVRLIWCSFEICEERESLGAATQRKYFMYGEVSGTTSSFYSADHLWSVRAVTDSSAVAVARYDYDPWGRRTVVLSNGPSSVGFTRHRYQIGNVSLALYRAYDADLGRWLSDDPIGLRGGINLTAYVDNSPIANDDALGLQRGAVIGPMPIGPKPSKIGPMPNPRFHDAAYYECLIISVPDMVGGGLLCAASSRRFGPAAAVICEVAAFVGWIKYCIQCATYCGSQPKCMPGPDLEPPGPPRVPPPPRTQRPPSRR